MRLLEVTGAFMIRFAVSEDGYAASMFQRRLMCL